MRPGEKLLIFALLTILAWFLLTSYGGILGSVHN